MPTHFYELAGDHAAERLRAHGALLTAAGLRVRLLHSRDRADLYLLVAEGEPPPGTAAAPEGARVWRFEPADAGPAGTAR